MDTTKERIRDTREVLCLTLLVALFINAISHILFLRGCWCVWYVAVLWGLFLWVKQGYGYVSRLPRTFWVRFYVLGVVLLLLTAIWLLLTSLPMLKLLN